MLVDPLDNLNPIFSQFPRNIYRLTNNPKKIGDGRLPYYAGSIRAAEHIQTCLKEFLPKFYILGCLKEVGELYMAEPI